MTTTPRLKIALGTYGHTAALKDGRVEIAGVEPELVEVVPIIGAFRRMVRDVAFDVCEMAPTTYMIARALGAPFIALPIFIMGRLHRAGRHRPVRSADRGLGAGRPEARRGLSRAHSEGRADRSGVVQAHRH